MPEGRKGELQSYFAAGGPSLEANACLPLFWKVLFATEDIHFAYVVDDYDPEDEAVELQEFLESAAPEEKDAKYPYLVTTKTLALECAARRRDRLIELLGERYRPIYDAFVEYIATAYGPFILVRTSGLPDATDATEWLTAQMEQVASLDGGTPIDAHLAEEAEALRRAADGDAVWRASGVGYAQAEVNPWPSKALVDAFPACAPRARATASANVADTTEKRKPTYRDQTGVDKALEWLAILLFGVTAVGTWYVTHSIWKAAVATVAVTAVMVWLMLRVQRTR